MMEGAKKKRKKNRSANSETEDLEDRISRLPDSLISHILSFLQMQDVIKTSFLARRWRSLWTTVPVLDFDCIRTIITHSLIRYKGVKIRKFRVIANNDVKEYEIDSWLHFTTKRGVEELDIICYFDCDDYCDDYYRMPRLLDYGSLRVLKLECCALHLRASDCFPSLRKLHLSEVSFTDINTSGCPLLEELIMECCTNCRNIFAPNEKLRYLKDHADLCSGLTIYAPYLLTIEFGGYIRQFYNLKSVSSVKSVIIDVRSDLLCRECFKESSTEPGEVMLYLIKNLGHAKTLKMSEHSIQMLGCDNILKMPSLNASSLEVDISFDNKSVIIMMVSLLNRTHHLENFIIRNMSKKFLRDYVDDTSWKSLALALHHLQLRTVTVHVFLGSVWYSIFSKDALMENLEKGEMNLIKLLLKGCRVLDKMVIRAMLPKCLKEHLQKNAKAKERFSKFQLALMSGLLLLPRASVNAGVEFSWNM